MGKSGKTKASKSGSKAEAKAAKKAKLASKAERKEAKKTKDVKSAGGASGSSGKKGKGKNKASVQDDDEEDLIQTLEEYRRKWQEDHKVTEETTDTPSRRANATLTACPTDSNILWLYGGEYFDGTSNFFFPDLFRYNIEKKEWKKLSSPNQPNPRSAHQIVPSPQGGGKLWLFGGEFASMNGNSFHHYRDLWCFDITNRTWERFDTKLKPSARSGHRMAAWRNYIVLFGGFHDTGIRTTYLSDLWLWDTTEYRWHEVQIRDADRKPQARSGFSFLPTPDGVVLHGGYCKEYSGKQVKGLSLDDTWFLKMDGDDLSKIKWERRRKIGYAPSVRSGVQMAYWQSKQMGIMFGGVFDSYENGSKDDEEEIASVFYNELFGYQLTGNGRWVSLMLKKPKKKPGAKQKKKAKKAAQQQLTHKGSDAQEGNNLEDQSNSQDLQPKKEHYDTEGDEEDVEGDEEPGTPAKTDGQNDSSRPASVCEMENDRDANEGRDGKQRQPQGIDNEDDEDDPDDPMKTIPIARYNAMMAVQRNTLFIYGGIVEAQNREYTLDDFSSLALDKLDRFVIHKECDIGQLEWKESDSEDDSDSESDGSDDDDEEDSSSEEGDGAEHHDGGATKAVKDGVDGDETEEAVEAVEAVVDTEDKELRARATAFLGVAKNTERSQEDILSTPLPGETLKTFYDRTREYWAQKAHAHSDNRGKALRKDGFQLADEKYQTYKPILEEIERIQAEAGLDDDDGKGASATKQSGLGVESRHRR